MAFKKVYVQTDEENEFITLFQQLCHNRSNWQVWSDLINVFACSISNSLDRVPKHFEEREKNTKIVFRGLVQQRLLLSFLVWL